jgi:60 kDa SS-A/Ro ribonucleoprotein
MITARCEPNHVIVAFSDQMIPFEVSPRERLDDVVKKTQGIRFGGTDCALPMLWALGYNTKQGANWFHNRAEYVKTRNNVIEADAFIILTDSETWFGAIHPVQALQQYRHETGIPAKLITVGMVSNGFSISDPNDGGMLDVVGMDTATPQLISDFIAG